MTGRAFTIATAEDGKFVDAIEKLIEGAIPRITIDGSTAKSDKPAKDVKADSKKPKNSKSKADKASSSKADKSATKPKSKSAKTTDDILAEQDSEQTAKSEPRRRRKTDSVRKDGHRSNQRGRGRDSGDDVLGFGDDIPAFMR
jgi:hypothetical protein